MKDLRAETFRAVMLRFPLTKPSVNEFRFLLLLRSSKNGGLPWEHVCCPKLVSSQRIDMIGTALSGPLNNWP